MLIVIELFNYQTVEGVFLGHVKTAYRVLVSDRHGSDVVKF